MHLAKVAVGTELADDWRGSRQQRIFSQQATANLGSAAAT
jgi:hypothetical protein